MVGSDGKEPKIWDIQYRIKYIRGTESSVSMASVLGLELRHPTMSTLWVQGDRSKKKKENNIWCVPTIMGETS